MTDLPSEYFARLTGTSALPRDNGSLAFRAPWEGRVLALAIALVERLDIPWDDFRQHLIASINDEPDRPYYESWAAGLEQLVLDHRLTNTGALDAATPVERPTL